MDVDGFVLLACLFSWLPSRLLITAFGDVFISQGKKSLDKVDRATKLNFQQILWHYFLSPANQTSKTGIQSIPDDNNNISSTTRFWYGCIEKSVNCGLYNIFRKRERENQSWMDGNRNLRVCMFVFCAVARGGTRRGELSIYLPGCFSDNTDMPEWWPVPGEKGTMLLTVVSPSCLRSLPPPSSSQ